MTIAVLYSCAECGIVDAAANVRMRGPDEEVRDWMNVCIYTLAFDHEKRSPQCRAKKLAAIKIPITGAPRIGDPATN